MSPSDLWVGGGNESVGHWDGFVWTIKNQLNPTEQPQFGSKGCLIIGPKSANIAQAWPTEDGQLIALDLDGNVRRYDGLSWDSFLPGPITTAEITSLIGLTQDVVVALDSAGTVLRRNNGRWSVGPNLLPPHKRDNSNPGALWASGESDIFAAAGNDEISHFDGNTWSVVYHVPNARFESIWGSSSKNVYATGGYQGLDEVHHYDGIKWVAEKLPDTHLAHIVYGLSENVVFAVGRQTVFRREGGQWKTLFHSERAFSYGTPIPAENYMSLDVSWGTGVDTLFVGGAKAEDGALQSSGVAIYSQPALLRCNGTACALERLPTSAQGPVTGLWGLSEQDVYAVADGSLYHFDGVSWTDAGLPKLRGLAVGGSLSTGVIALGVDRTTEHSLVFRYEGGSWKELADLPPRGLYASLNAIWDGSPTGVYLSGPRRILRLSSLP
ncbi:MAG: hypothetical protein JRH20_13360 [Deltaproteobacteria bacterium]|nr:hypothetical protein [Deltaproteobacteria bacterium]